MDVYRLLQLNRLVRSHRIKFLGLYILHVFKMRYLAVNLDPVMACNLRCKMCYFTDKDYVKKLKGVFKKEQLERVAKVIFKRALKLQIGCGTEPTLYKDLPAIVRLGKHYKVPYISLTTNANLLNEEKIIALLDAGLDEFTISLHGVTKETYETFMGKGDYSVFMNVFKTFGKLKKTYNFRVRINYTFNKDNFYELKEFFTHFDKKSFDILQLRPIKRLHNADYTNIDLGAIEDDYEGIITAFKEECKTNDIILMAPRKIGRHAKQKNYASDITEYTFCYVSPQDFWRKDFDWENETYDAYATRTKWSKTLWKNIFISENDLRLENTRLNYEIDLN